MKNLNKLISLLCVFAMIVCLFAACSNENTNETPTDTQESETEATTDPVTDDGVFDYEKGD